jgi:cell wall-associated NlpC family hydrolase
MARHPNLRVEGVQPLTVSAGGRLAHGAQADQANAGTVVDYLDATRNWLGTSREDWASSFAQRIGAKGPAAVQFVMAWTLEEGASTWANNPLNSSLPMTGSSLLAGNPDGVRIYPSVLSGLDADARTLLGNPAYAPVVAALRAGNVVQAAAALQSSPWCVGSSGGQCPGYGATIENLVALWNLVALGQKVSTPNSGVVLATGAEPVGSVLTPVSTPAGAPANFGPVWQFLEAQLGKPYQWAGAGPDTWDCSGLVMAAYDQAGIHFVHYAASQYSATANHPVALAALEPGDLLFWAYTPGDPSSIHHVAVYVGDGMVLDALQTGTPVQIQPLWTDGLYGATRPLAGG